MPSETVRHLIDNAVEENSDFLEMLVGSFMSANDVGVDDVELVVDTYDPQRIVMYPRLKPEEGETTRESYRITNFDRASTDGDFSAAMIFAARRLPALGKRVFF